MGLIEDDKTNLVTGRPIRKPLFIESITEMTDPNSNTRVRVWRKVDKIPETDDMEIGLCLHKLAVGITIHDLFDALGSIEGVTAVEVVDAAHQGAVLYYEW